MDQRYSLAELLDKKMKYFELERGACVTLHLQEVQEVRMAVIKLQIDGATRWVVKIRPQKREDVQHLSNPSIYTDRGLYYEV